MHIHCQSVTILKPLTSKINNIDHLIKCNNTYVDVNLIQNTHKKWLQIHNNPYSSVIMFPAIQLLLMTTAKSFDLAQEPSPVTPALLCRRIINWTYIVLKNVYHRSKNHIENHKNKEADLKGREKRVGGSKNTIQLLAAFLGSCVLKFESEVECLLYLESAFLRVEVAEEKAHPHMRCV